MTSEAGDGRPEGEGDRPEGERDRPEGGDDRPETVVEKLAEANVIEPVGDGFRMTDGFAARLDRCRGTVSELDEASLREELRAVGGEEVEASVLLELDNEEVVAEFLALGEGTELSDTERLRAMTAFDSLTGAPPPSSGSPDPFVPVHGDRVPFLTRVYDRTIVYVWKEDCRPCDLVREDLEGILETDPADVALFSVYGPDSARELYDRYSVDGAPTLLFFLHGEVDVRLRGAQYPQVVETEVETLRQLGE